MSEPETWGLDLEDLLIPFDEARAGAVRAAASGGWLDAFLLAAGCLQVIEDQLHASEGLPDRLATHLESHPPRRPLAGVVGAAANGRRIAAHTHRGARKLRSARDGCVDLVCDLAVAATSAHTAHESGGTAEDCVSATASAPCDISLAERVARLLGAPWPDVDGDRSLRLPSCFRSFDQHPADVAELVARYAAESSRDFGLPILVAGVRTSGSYLGPLAVAELRRLGYQAVRLVTVRPGERLDPSQRSAARAVGACLVIDDPPVSGAAIQRCIDELHEAGLRPGAVHLLLAMPDGWAVPPRLAEHPSTVLSSGDWHVARSLDPAAVAASAAMLLAASGQELCGPLRSAPDPLGDTPGGLPRTPREHRREAFAVTISDPQPDGGPARLRPATLLVQGVGIGLFGHHDLVVNARLGHQVPLTLGVSDGVLYQLLGPPDAPVHPVDMATSVAYLVERHRALPRPADRAEEMAGRMAAWEVAGLIIGQALGRPDPALRLPVVHPLVRRLLQVEKPSIVDGRISPDRWVPGLAGDLVKLDATDGAFSNRDLWSYDPIRDLAALGDELGRPTEVRNEWERHTGDIVEPSRWLLLRLVHAWDRHRLGGLTGTERDRAWSAALADFVADLLLSDVPPADLGPAAKAFGWCALDIDGVLETGVVAGASAPGWDGAMALRGLLAHDHRVVLATGRGADEVAQRCLAWGLPGAVAEYGAALVLPDGRVVDQRDPASAVDVERARSWLQHREDVVVDAGHRFAIRAWRSDAAKRSPLLPKDVTGAIRAAGGALEAVPGEDQTDFVPRGNSKAAGVEALLDRLDFEGGCGSWTLVFAAGDSPADVGLLGLAELAVAPAHAAAEVRRAANVPVRGRFQAGLREGVAALLGHEPGECARCRPAVSAGHGTLLSALSVREAGPQGMPMRLARLVRTTRRLR